MTFQGRSLEADNPIDIGTAARKALRKLKTIDSFESTFDELYNRFFGSQEPRDVVKKACQAMIEHTTSPLTCESGRLVLDKPDIVREYCQLIQDHPDELFKLVP